MCLCLCDLCLFFAVTSPSLPSAKLSHNLHAQATETGVPAMVKGQWAADPSTILFVLSSVVGDVLLPIVVVCGVALAAVVGLWQSRGDSSRDVSSSTSSINESRRGGGSNDSSTDDPSTSESCTQSPGFGWVQRGLQLVLCVRSLIDAALTLAVATGGLAGQVSGECCV